MAKRKVKTVEAAIKRNHPEIRDMKDWGVPELQRITNLPAAGRRIKYAVSHGQHIFLFADYDADGICSASEFKIIFENLGLKESQYTIRFPHRFTEGYGMQPGAVDEVPDGALLITVDNGIAAKEAIAKAKARRLTVIVIDHHPLNEGETLPPADIIVDPHAIEGSTFDDYCGAGLTLKLAEFLIGTKTKAMQRIYGFAAIATIADVVSLKGDNWIIARNGMEFLKKGTGVTTGMKAVLAKAGCDKILTEEDLGFKIIPQLNAPGRLMDNGAEIVYEAVSYDGSYPAAMAAANRLSDINAERKKEVESGMKAAVGQIESLDLDKKTCLTLYLPGVGEGIAGIIAGRVSEEYKRPAFILTKPKFPKEEGVLKGSGRSYGDIDLKEVLTSVSPYLYGYGGHPGAAGISVKEENLKNLDEALNHAIPKVDESSQAVIEPDMEIKQEEIPEVMTKLEKYAPYGEGNPKIIFHIKKWIPEKVRTMGANGEHLRIDGKDSVNAIAFFADPSWISSAQEKEKQGKPIELEGSLSVDHYRSYGKDIASTSLSISNLK